MQSCSYFSMVVQKAAILASRGQQHQRTLSLLKISSTPPHQRCFLSNGQQQLQQDFYEVLGLEKTASAKDIKAAYYELSKKYHPDVATGSADSRRFHQITEAYERLGNDEKRRTYDEEQQQRVGGAGGMYGGVGGMTGSEYRDVDLEMLRELQRKWDMRRRHYTDASRARAQQWTGNNNSNKDRFEIKDKEEFESFYRRYRENVHKARRWDENAAEAAARRQQQQQYQGERREHYSEFQKEMLRRQHQRQMDHAASGSVFIGALLVSLLLLFILGGHA